MSKRTVMIIGRDGAARAEGGGPLPDWMEAGMRVDVRPLEFPLMRCLTELLREMKDVTAHQNIGMMLMPAAYKDLISRVNRALEAAEEETT